MTAINSEVHHILDMWAKSPSMTTAVTSSILRKLMLYTEGRVSSCGYIWDIEKKSLGAGVYRLSLKKI